MGDVDGHGERWGESFVQLYWIEIFTRRWQNLKEVVLSIGVL